MRVSGTNRRAFIAGLGSAAAWPLVGRAERSMPVVGVLTLDSPGLNATWLIALRKGLNEAGFIEDRNVTIETRWAEGQYDRLPTLISDLVRLPSAVLFASGSAAIAQAARKATTTIPIVFATGSDPVKVGLVASMNRPGGNATGVSFYTSALGSKRLELLRELVPQATKIGFLVNPTNPVAEGDIKDIQQAAQRVGQTIVVVNASSEAEIDGAFATLAREGAGALLVDVDAFFSSRRHHLAALAARYHLPASYNNSDYVVAGGLMSYGDNRFASFRQAGIYVGRILKGEKPGDLPVLQPTKFELVLNLNTARSLGLTIPAKIIAVADEVIE